MSETTTLRMERTFEAPAQAVFDAWTSEEVIRRWWHAEHDWETTEAEVDLRVGGTVRVVMRNPHEDVEYGGGGRYTEIEPPTRLAFTWIWDGNDTRQLIELDFEETDGVTTVRFTHSDLWDEEAVRSHEERMEQGLRQPRARPARGFENADMGYAWVYGPETRCRCFCWPESSVRRARRRPRGRCSQPSRLCPPPATCTSWGTSREAPPG